MAIPAEERHAPARPAEPNASEAPQRLRVLTVNTHKGFTAFNRRFVLHELREAVRAVSADIVFLQEVLGEATVPARHRHGPWPTSQYEFLADSIWPQYAYGKNAVHRGGHHGNALLSRFPIVELENRDVSDHALEKRGVLHCTVDVGGRRVHCFVVHFGLLAASRERQLDALLGWIESEVPSDQPLIVAGDFNDWRNTLSERLCSSIGVVEVFDAVRPRLESLQRAAYFVRDRLVDVGALQTVQVSRLPRMVRTARTYPALVPWFRMDRIYQRGFRVTSARVLRGLEWARLSDHSPLVADLELPDESA